MHQSLSVIFCELPSSNCSFGHLCQTAANMRSDLQKASNSSYDSSCRLAVKRSEADLALQRVESYQLHALVDRLWLGCLGGVVKLL